MLTVIHNVNKETQPLPNLIRNGFFKYLEIHYTKEHEFESITCLVYQVSLNWPNVLKPPNRVSIKS